MRSVKERAKQGEAFSLDAEDNAAELELRRLLVHFDVLHANTLEQLDRTDAALDRALAHFQRP